LGGTARSNSPGRGMSGRGYRDRLCVGRVGRREPSITGKWLSIRKAWGPHFRCLGLVPTGQGRSSTRAPLLASNVKPTGRNSRIEPWRSTACSRNGTLWNMEPLGLLRLDVAGADHVRPLLDFIIDQLA